MVGIPVECSVSGDVQLEWRSRLEYDSVFSWGPWQSIPDTGIFSERVNNCIQVRVKPKFTPGYFRSKKTLRQSMADVRWFDFIEEAYISDWERVAVNSIGDCG